MAKIEDEIISSDSECEFTYMDEILKAPPETMQFEIEKLKLFVQHIEETTSKTRNLVGFSKREDLKFWGGQWHLFEKATLKCEIEHCERKMRALEELQEDEGNAQFRWKSTKFEDKTVYKKKLGEMSDKELMSEIGRLSKSLEFNPGFDEQTLEDNLDVIDPIEGVDVELSEEESDSEMES